MRASLCSALAPEQGIDVAGESADVLAAVRIAAKGACTVAIVAAGLVPLGSRNGVDALKPLARRLPVVVIGMGDPAAYTGPYVAAGALGYWSKSDDITTLTDLLQRAAGPQRSAA